MRERKRIPSDKTHGTPIRQFIKSQERYLILWLVGFRLVNALTLKTFFQPDEYFQSLEPAWRIAFGERSGAWPTWEWREQLRSSIHPYMFAAIYKATSWIADVASVSDHVHAEMLLAAPKVLGAVTAAYMDYYTWRFATKHTQADSDIPIVTLFLTLLNPWQWFCSTRTLINSLESMLTAAALFYWPWELFVGQSSDPRITRASLRKALSLAAIACVLRAPNVIIWVVTAGCCAMYMLLFNRRSIVTALTALSIDALCCGSIVFALSAILDRQFYGEWTLPPLHFLQFNLIQNLAVFYGQNRPDYYLTEGLPLVMTTALPFAVFTIVKVACQTASKASASQPTMHQLHALRDTTLMAVVVFTTAALSYISHKEARFVHPLVSTLTWFASRAAVPVFRPWLHPAKPLQRLRLLPLILINLSIALYAGIRHQRGVVDVTHFLRGEFERLHPNAANTGSPSGPMSVGFLMPCHSTPWRSHLVYEDMRAWALTCEPPLNMSLHERAQYLDEADVFYKDPSLWLEGNMRPLSSIKSSVGAHIAASGADGVQDSEEREWPSHLVFFENLKPVLEQHLAGTRYRQCWHQFNSDWHDDWRRKGAVVVWCLR
ncbi:hypothetical protein ANO11243_022650 [Dothideomycetidae sp. 11243]|nr:hypothetical protein ANO11243_022650 [fungal sp. No.11243]